MLLLSVVVHGSSILLTCRALQQRATPDMLCCPVLPCHAVLCCAVQQRVTPDIQTGCISCASGDGKFGGPVWWNTPMDDGDAEAEGAEANRSTWGAPGGGGGGGGGGGHHHQQQQQQQQGGGGKKRAAEAFEDDDELPDEVRARLEALKRAG
jgi:bud site selection protein 31